MSARDAVKAHYAAYGSGDVDAVLATLAPDFRCAALNGETWITDHAKARTVYTRNMADYPLQWTTMAGEIALGDVVIKRETSLSADGSKPTTEAMPIYTVRDGLIARLDMPTGTAAWDHESVKVAAAQLDAYNAQDLDAFCSFFTDDIVVADLNGAENLHGMEAYRARYAGVFGQYPENRVELLGRLAVRNFVVDHEKVMRSPDAEPFEVLAIYTLRDGKIARVDFVK